MNFVSPMSSNFKNPLAAYIELNQYFNDSELQVYLLGLEHHHAGQGTYKRLWGLEGPSGKVWAWVLVAFAWLAFCGVLGRRPQLGGGLACDQITVRPGVLAF
jgi:hypothetical protein